MIDTNKLNLIVIDILSSAENIEELMAVDDSFSEELRWVAHRITSFADHYNKSQGEAP